MTKAENIENDIQSILAADAVDTEAWGRQRDEEVKISALGTQIEQGINGDGDPPEVAKILAPIQVEHAMRKVRLPKLEAATAAAGEAYRKTCARAANHYQRVAKEFLGEALNRRRGQFAEIFADWGIPEENSKGFPVLLTVSGDKLQPIRNLTEELSEIARASAAGQGISASRVIQALKTLGEMTGDSE